MPKKNKASRKARKQKKNNNAKASQTNPTKAQAQREPYAASSNVRRSLKPRGNIAAVPKSVHEAVCSVTDPFCYKARCAKWPDGQGGGTVAYQVRGRRLLTGNATGDSFIQYTGDVPFAILTPASAGSGNWTMNSAFEATPGAADFVSYAKLYRVVSWGIIIRNINTANNCSGTVIVRKMNTFVNTSNSISQKYMYGVEVYEYPLYPGCEFSVIAKTAGNNARTFVQQNTSAVPVNAYNWEAIQVEVIGGYTGASGTGGNLCDIEHVYNVEFQLKETQLGLHEFIPPSVPHVPKVIEASSAVVNKATTVIEGGVKAVGEHVLSKVEDFFTNAGTDLLSLLF